MDEKWILPPAVETLILKDTQISLHNITLMKAIANHTPLKELDLSLGNLCKDDLEVLSKGLVNLQYLNMSG